MLVLLLWPFWGLYWMARCSQVLSPVASWNVNVSQPGSAYTSPRYNSPVVIICPHSWSFSFCMYNLGFWQRLKKDPYTDFWSFFLPLRDSTPVLYLSFFALLCHKVSSGIKLRWSLDSPCLLSFAQGSWSCASIVQYLNNCFIIFVQSPVYLRRRESPLQLTQSCSEVKISLPSVFIQMLLQKLQSLQQYSLSPFPALFFPLVLIIQHYIYLPVLFLHYFPSLEYKLHEGRDFCIFCYQL